MRRLNQFFFLAIALAAVAFIIDVGLDVDTGPLAIPYAVAIWLAFPSRSRSTVWGVAVLVSVLFAVGTALERTAQPSFAVGEALVVTVFVVMALILTTAVQHSGSEASEELASDGHREDRLLDFVKTSNNWYWETGPDMRFSFVSDRIEEIAKIPIGAMLGKTREELAGHVDDPVRWADHKALVDRREAFNDFEYTRIQSGGLKQIISVSGRPFFNEHGEFQGYRGVGRDVTHERQLEAAQAETIALLRLALDSNPDFIYWIDAELRIAGCNDAFAKLFGHASSVDLVGVNCDDLLASEEEADLSLANLRHVLNTGMTLENITRQKIDPDGNVLILSSSCFPLKDEKGQVIGVLMVDRDITEYQRFKSEILEAKDRVEQANQELEERVRLRTLELAETNERANERASRLMHIINTASDGIITIDGSGTVLSFSPAAERVFGYQESEVLGRNVKMLMPQRTAQQHDGFLKRYRETGAATVVGSNREVVGRRKDGSEFPMDLAVGDTGVAGEWFFTGIVRDITDRKQAEDELMAAKDAAEAASQAKSAFLANMSHEIRTPMNGIIGMIDVLTQNELGKDETKMVSTIRESAVSLMGIIEDILDFSTLDAGEMDLAVADLSVEEEVDQACLQLDHFALSKRVDLMLYVDPEIPSLVRGDALRVRQIVGSLLNNAIKFSSAPDRMGQVDISVILNRYEGENAWIDFRIQDDGIGIDDEAKKRLFEPFEQADLATTKQFGGTGLGLVITHGLVEKMGGTLTLDSTPGEGTMVHVRLPFPVREKIRLGRTSKIDGLECVIVDDASALRECYSRYLSAAGARVYHAENVEAGYDVLPETSEGPREVCFVVIEEPAASSQEIVDKLISSHPEETLSGVIVSYLSVERGRRRKPRRLSEHVLQLDRQVLTRRALIGAVAIAAGRLSLEESGEAARAEIAPVMEEPDRLQPKPGARILIAEDTLMNQDVIAGQLKAIGLVADLADNGVQAMERWRERDYELLLTDLHMPEMDGYHLALGIREEEARSGRDRMPIIALTANALRDEEQRCRDLGMDDYLTKPLELKRLREAMTPIFPDLLAPKQPVDKEEIDADELIGSNEMIGGDEMIGAARAPVDVKPSEEADGDDQSDAGGAGDEPEMMEGGVLAFDPSVLAIMVGDDPELQAILTDQFLESTEQSLIELNAHLLSRNGEEYGMLSHRLKSSVRTFGANRLGNDFAMLEMAAKQGDWNTIEELHQKIAPGFDVIRAHYAKQ